MVVGSEQLILAGYATVAYWHDESTTTDYGSVVGSGTWNLFYLLPGVPLSLNIEWVKNVGLGNYDVQKKTAVKHDVPDLTLEMPLMVVTNNIGSWSLAKLGMTAPTNQFSIALKMSWIDSDGGAPPADQTTTDYVYLYGCYIKNVTINASNGEQTTVSLTFSVRQALRSASAPNTLHAGTSVGSQALLAAEVPMIFSDMSITFGAGYTNTPSGAYTDSQSISLSVDWGHEKRWGNASILPRDCQHTKREAKFELETDNTILASQNVLYFLKDAIALDEGSTCTIVTDFGGTAITFTNAHIESYTSDLEEIALIGQSISFVTNTLSVA